MHIHAMSEISQLSRTVHPDLLTTVLGSRRRISATGAILLTGSAMAACTGSGAANSQDGTLSLLEPEATFPTDFGYFSTVRELADGRVLLADPLGKALYVVDLEEGTREQIGTLGEGPDEYRQPDATWALPGDSTLLVDLGNTRLVRLGPDFTFGETYPIMAMSASGGSMHTVLPSGVDEMGRVYSSGFSNLGPGGVRADSGFVLRTDLRESTVDTVGTYLLQKVDVSESGSANNRSVSVSPVPFSPEDAWGVAPDGSLVVARATDYRVEWRSPTGEVVIGEPVAYDPVPIGTDDKLKYLADQRRDGVSMAVRQENGRLTATMSRGFGSGRDAPDLDQYTWPEYLPAFDRGRIPVDPHSRAWVRRQVSSGSQTVYDLFGRDARHLASLTMGSGREVVGFGSETVYVVYFNEYDLAFLERYSLPAT